MYKYKLNYSIYVTNCYSLSPVSVILLIYVYIFPILYTIYIHFMATVHSFQSIN